VPKPFVADNIDWERGGGGASKLGMGEVLRGGGASKLGMCEVLRGGGASKLGMGDVLRGGPEGPLEEGRGGSWDDSTCGGDTMLGIDNACGGGGGENCACKGARETERAELGGRRGGSKVLCEGAWGGGRVAEDAGRLGGPLGGDDCGGGA
jgi:hypothetical protein